MKKLYILIISVLFFSCATEKTIIRTQNSELELLLKTRFADEKTRNDVYDDIMNTFYIDSLTIKSDTLYASDL